jgi:indolepyruvate ferredoxin oxidoreductase beta subunit
VLVKRTCLLVVGVGGQGVLTAARVLGEAARLAEQPVVISRLHGMSQRGGSVEASVLFGPGKSSFIPRGGAQIVLALEPMEALRARDRLGPDTSVIVSRHPLVPTALSVAGKPYPRVDSLLAAVRRITPHVFELDGNVRMLNTLMLGVLAGRALLPFDGQCLQQAVTRCCRPESQADNRRAFAAGYELALAAEAAGPDTARPVIAPEPVIEKP